MKFQDIIAGGVAGLVGIAAATYFYKRKQKKRSSEARRDGNTTNVKTPSSYRKKHPKANNVSCKSSTRPQVDNDPNMVGDAATPSVNWHNKLQVPDGLLLCRAKDGAYYNCGMGVYFGNTTRKCDSPSETEEEDDELFAEPLTPSNMKDAKGAKNKGMKNETAHYLHPNENTAKKPQPILLRRRGRVSVCYMNRKPNQTSDPTLDPKLRQNQEPSLGGTKLSKPKLAAAKVFQPTEGLVSAPKPKRRLNVRSTAFPQPNIDSEVIKKGSPFKEYYKVILTKPELDDKSDQKSNSVKDLKAANKVKSSIDLKQGKKIKSETNSKPVKSSSKPLKKTKFAASPQPEKKYKSTTNPKTPKKSPKKSLPLPVTKPGIETKQTECCNLLQHAKSPADQIKTANLVSLVCCAYLIWVVCHF